MRFLKYSLLKPCFGSLPLLASVSSSLDWAEFCEEGAAAVDAAVFWSDLGRSCSCVRARPRLQQKEQRWKLFVDVSTTVSLSTVIHCSKAHCFLFVFWWKWLDSKSSSLTSINRHCIPTIIRIHFKKLRHKWCALKDLPRMFFLHNQSYLWPLTLFCFCFPFFLLLFSASFSLLGSRCILNYSNKVTCTYLPGCSFVRCCWSTPGCLGFLLGGFDKATEICLSPSRLPSNATMAADAPLC